MKIYLVAAPDEAAVGEQINKIFPDARIHDISESGVAAQLERDLASSGSSRGASVVIRNLGDFQVLVDGEQLRFEREKARELMAMLVEHHGQSVTTRQIAEKLWPGQEYDSKMKNRATRTVSSLKNTLNQAGAGDVLVKSWNMLAIDPDLYTYES